MVVSTTVDNAPTSKMNTVRTRKPLSSTSSGFRLLDGDQLEASSSVSKSSVYKLKIDLMFDDTRSTRSHRLDDTRGSHRTRSIIMYGRSELASTTGDTAQSIASLLKGSAEATKILTTSTKKDVQCISNSVQAQIEQLFTDVAKDATSSFAVLYLGSLPLKSKVTSLQGLQEPLRDLYLKELVNKRQNSGFLDICTTGLRVKISSSSSNDENITPFHNIAVWSAVKFVVSDVDGSAAFLPLITDPENIDKTSLFRPLCATEKKYVPNSEHSPIFAVVMRSSCLPKVLECHAFICRSTEDAIVIAATLYQSLMEHVNTSSYRNTKRRAPRNQNGVSCISIASSSARTGSNHLSRSQAPSKGRKSSFRSSSDSLAASVTTPTRSGRKKRSSNSTLSSSSNIITEAAETTTEERKRKSHKSKRAPPIPNGVKNGNPVHNDRSRSMLGLKNAPYTDCVCNSASCRPIFCSHHHGKKSLDSIYKFSGILDDDHLPDLSTVENTSNSGLRNDTNGDILTRVAIPRSGSFLNTGGLTRYKSRVARRHSGKFGGGGGSPLGFSELFNEFRLHENLHSLDEILYAIIDADGMSFNDLKPIYKEFLLKLAVTLTKDELFQRSKNIMRRQRKKKLKRHTSTSVPPKRSKTIAFGTKTLKKVFHLGHFRSCRGKSAKSPRNKVVEDQTHRMSGTVTMQPSAVVPHNDQQRSRIATSGSDVSVVRHDNNLRGLNRNSSSGYVSCSECSYDSESCTCTTADRCYCSLRSDHISSRLRLKNEHNTALPKNCTDGSRQHKNNFMTGSKSNRDSFISCKLDEKCYCSMVEEEEPSPLPDNDSANTHSDTTWCDTDSCISASKCYCKRGKRLNRSTVEEANTSQSRQAHYIDRAATEKLALDYELFTIGGNCKTVQPHEALSVKKSVEAAAIFADVKLIQTTDIKSVCPLPANKSKPSSSIRSGCSTGTAESANKSSSNSIDHRNKHQNADGSSYNSSQNSHSDDLVEKFSASEKRSGSVKSTRSNGQTLLTQLERRESFRSNYQSMRAVRASLEETLGYLP